jgi:predicted amidophosphoribosyltransferase
LFPAVDLVIPVPLHAARLCQRGYNQSDLLARRCAAVLGLRCDTQVLRRHRATPPQVGLSAPDRRANVQGAFELTSPSRAARLAGRRILLVPAVTTTGSTLDAAAALLPARPAVLCGLAVTRPDVADDVRDTQDASPLRVRTSMRGSRPQ